MLAIITALSCAIFGQTPAESKTADAYRESYAREAKGELIASLAALQPLATASGEDYVYHLRRGWLLYLLGRHTEAIAAYDRSLALKPKALEPRLGIMLPLMAARRWVEAEKRGQEALQTSPSDFTALSRIAFIHYSQQRYDQAAAFYQKALDLFPSNVEMQAGLGWTLLKQNRAKEAREVLSRVLTIAPDYASAREAYLQLP